MTWQLLKEATIASVRHNILGTAKGAAFSALLSFFPVLTTVTAILVQANAHAVSRNLTTLVFRVVPPGTEDIVTEVFTQRGHKPLFLLVVAAFVSVAAAGGIMLSLMEGFRSAYGIPEPRPFLKNRGIATVLVFAAGLPVVAASVLIVLGRALESWFLPQGHLAGLIAAAVSPFVRYLIATGAIVVATTFLYSLGPNPSRPVADVFPGAVLATALWGLATSGFAWYVRNIADYNVLYGSVGAVIALLIWMYMLSVIALFGGEYNAARERHFGVRQVLK